VDVDVRSGSPGVVVAPDVLSSWSRVRRGPGFRSRKASRSKRLGLHGEQFGARGAAAAGQVDPDLPRSIVSGSEAMPAVGPAEQGPDPRQQLPGSERLVT